MLISDSSYVLHPPELDGSTCAEPATQHRKDGFGAKFLCSFLVYCRIEDFNQL